MSAKIIPESELILNPDGSLYHLNCLPGDVAPTLILVGDPERVPKVSKHFDTIEVKKQKREIITHTGTIGKKRISVVSTGMGVGCIDIVINELDALFNVDLTTRQVKENLTTLKMIRIGTCGCLDPNIAVDDYIVNQHAIGFDGFFQFYQSQYSDTETALLEKVKSAFAELPVVNSAYVAESRSSWYDNFRKDCHNGIVLTCVGFYGPQNRAIRTPLSSENLFDMAESLTFNNNKIVNFEMETSAIYGLSRLLNHEALSVNLAVANRAAQKFSADPKTSMAKLIPFVLERL